MPLTNAQYDRMERDYERRRQRAAREREERIAEARREIPELAELEARLSDLAFARAKARITGNAMSEALQNEQMETLRTRRNRLLAQAGFAEDYLELRFECPSCRDTGYVNGEPCTCRKRAMIDLLYDQSAIREALKRENFSTFRLDVYDDTKIDAPSGLTYRELMQKHLEAARLFVEHFGETTDNLLFTGKPGAGKTFLSNCIAGALIDRCRSVLYLTASQLFDALALQTFERGTADETAERIFDCDLLIIDDLGTELSNRFTESSLFSCLNGRMLRGAATLISTNLGLNEMRDAYSERVTSRLMGGYRVLRFPDQDIRMLKSMERSGRI